MDRKIENLRKAVSQLELSLSSPVTEPRDLAGIVKCFEFSYELAWKALKAELGRQGLEAQGPRDVIRMAWRFGLLAVGSEEAWLKMIEDRNLTVHTYDEVFALEMVSRIRTSHAPFLRGLVDELSTPSQ